VQVVRDGAEALDFIFCQSPYSGRKIEDMPRVMMLDLKLPKLEGLEVLQRIKSDPRTKRIPVVVLTSSKEQRDVVAGYGMGEQIHRQAGGLRPVRQGHAGRNVQAAAQQPSETVA
jgi:two-component system response regulator